MMVRAALNRLQWRCTRRAFLELDLILGKFLADVFPSLDEAQAQIFAELADMEDHDLWPLICGTVPCLEPQRAQVLLLLRNSGQLIKDEMSPVERQSYDERT